MSLLVPVPRLRRGARREPANKSCSESKPAGGEEAIVRSLLSRLSWSLVLLNRGARSWSSSDTNLSEVACTVQDARGISVSVAREI